MHSHYPAVLICWSRDVSPLQELRSEIDWDWDTVLSHPKLQGTALRSNDSNPWESNGWINLALGGYQAHGGFASEWCDDLSDALHCRYLGLALLVPLSCSLMLLAYFLQLRFKPPGLWAPSLFLQTKVVICSACSSVFFCYAIASMYLTRALSVSLSLSKHAAPTVLAGSTAWRACTPSELHYPNKSTATYGHIEYPVKHLRLIFLVYECNWCTPVFDVGMSSMSLSISTSWHFYCFCVSFMRDWQVIL